MKRFIIAAATFITAALYGFSDDKPVQIAFEVESGALKVLYHTYRVGAGSSTFNFVTQGGQEILFPFERLTASTTLIDRHQIRFLYQSLELNTRITARENFTIDNVSFNTGDVVDITYGFPFYRFTYLYDFLPGESELALGAALQFRNASISFTSADGTKRAISQNLGLVPALAVSGRFPFATHFFAAFDATGIYASSAFFNGANFSFEGFHSGCIGPWGNETSEGSGKLYKSEIYWWFSSGGLPISFRLLDPIHRKGHRQLSCHHGLNRRCHIDLLKHIEASVRIVRQKPKESRLNKFYVLLLNERDSFRLATPDRCCQPLSLSLSA